VFLPYLSFFPGPGNAKVKTRIPFFFSLSFLSHKRDRAFTSEITVGGPSSFFPHSSPVEIARFASTLAAFASGLVDPSFSFFFEILPFLRPIPLRPFSADEKMVQHDSPLLFFPPPPSPVLRITD